MFNAVWMSGLGLLVIGYGFLHRQMRFRSGLARAWFVVLGAVFLALRRLAAYAIRCILQCSFQMAETLGTFEQAVLLAIIRLADEAYGRQSRKRSEHGSGATWLRARCRQRWNDWKTNA